VRHRDRVLLRVRGRRCPTRCGKQFHLCVQSDPSAMPARSHLPLRRRSRCRHPRLSVQRPGWGSTPCRMPLPVTRVAHRSCRAGTLPRSSARSLSEIANRGGRMSALPIPTWTPFNGLLRFLLFASVEACGATSALPVADSGPRDDSALACANDTDCGGTERCYFLVSEGCSATGTCLERPFTGACRSPTWCGCDGNAVVVCAPDGYSPQPIVSQTLCEAGTPTDVSANH
jgi:hypothetical protein